MFRAIYICTPIFNRVAGWGRFGAMCDGVGGTEDVHVQCACVLCKYQCADCMHTRTLYCGLSGRNRAGENTHTHQSRVEVPGESGVPGDMVMLNDGWSAIVYRHIERGNLFKVGWYDILVEWQLSYNTKCIIICSNCSCLWKTTLFSSTMNLNNVVFLNI